MAHLTLYLDHMNLIVKPNHLIVLYIVCAIPKSVPKSEVRKANPLQLEFLKFGLTQFEFK